ncbi:hypothetical protein HOY82DRAFT_302198 [Tuber indicum]|nr:hypothetical protein HOY82DRAFT_302198 [Tuber indicum]
MDGYCGFVLCCVAGCVLGSIEEKQIRVQRSAGDWAGVSLRFVLLCFTLRGLETVHYSTFSYFKGFSLLLPLSFSFSPGIGFWAYFLTSYSFVPSYFILFFWYDFSSH